MEAELRAHLFALAAAYGAARGLEQSTVARQAAGDWRFFERLKTSASFTAKKYDSIVAWFAANWPADLQWPAAVERPPQDAAA